MTQSPAARGLAMTEWRSLRCWKSREFLPVNPDTLLSGTNLLPVGLALASVAGLVVSDYRDYRPGRYLFKPLAALAFVWLAISAGAT